MLFNIISIMGKLCIYHSAMCEFPKLITTFVPSVALGGVPRIINLDVPCGKYIKCKKQIFPLALDIMRSAIRLQGEKADLFNIQMQTTLYNLNEILPLEKEKLSKYFEEVMPREIEKIIAETKCSYAQASAAYANAFYTQVLAKGQQIRNDFDSAVLGSGAYRSAITNTAIANLGYARHHATYESWHSRNERIGAPYVINKGSNGSWHVDFSKLIEIGGSYGESVPMTPTGTSTISFNYTR